VVFKLTYQP